MPQSIISLDRQSGELRWRTDLIKGGGSLTLLGDDLFVYDRWGGGHLTCLDSNTGKIRWDLELRDPDHPRAGFFTNTQIAVTNQIVYVGRPHSLYEVNRSTGSVIGRIQLPRPMFSGPLLAQDRLIYSSDDGTIHARQIPLRSD
jgi:outer membrane protein assembly factor BamB